MEFAGAQHASSGIVQFFVGLTVLVLSAMILNGVRNLKKRKECAAVMDTCHFGPLLTSVDVMAGIGVAVGSGLILLGAAPFVMMAMA